MSHDFELGKRFGSLTVIKQVQSRGSPHTRWECRCDCGKTYVSRGATLVDGTTTRCKSCAAAASVACRNRPNESAIDPLASALLAIYNVAARHVDDSRPMQEIMDLCHAALSK